MNATQSSRIARRRQQRLASTRRFTLAGTLLGAAAMLVATSISFTATGGSTIVGVSPTSATIGEVLAQGNDALPNSGSGIGNLPGTGWPAAGAASTGSGTVPVWTPIEGQSVAVTTAGDIAVIDARGLAGNVYITLTLTNAAELGGAYAYFILPVEIEAYSDASSGSWSGANGADSGPAIGRQFLTLANGFITFLVDGGSLYGITIPTGGSIFTVNDGGTLSPVFHVSTRPS